MTGATIGPKKNASAKARHRGCRRARPSAAEVPVVTDKRHVSVATSRLVTSARNQEGSAKKALHQRNDQLSGGRRTKLCWLKASGTTARTGMTISAARNAARAFVQRPASVIPPPPRR